jgi:hypothetical protein
MQPDAQRSGRDAEQSCGCDGFVGEQLDQHDGRALLVPQLRECRPHIGISVRLLWTSLSAASRTSDSGRRSRRVRILRR